MEEKVLDEFEMKDLLIEKRKEIKNFDDLVSYLEYVKDNCNYDYGVAPCSIAQAALAVAWYLACDFGITGFQAGFITWEFIRGFTYTSNKCGLRLIDYNDMLYPQYEYKFTEKIITSDIWNILQNQAKEKLEKHPNANPSVVKHWQSIVDGKVPFGYVVKDD